MLYTLTVLPKLFIIMDDDDSSVIFCGFVGPKNQVPVNSSGDEIVVIDCVRHEPKDVTNNRVVGTVDVASETTEGLFCILNHTFYSSP